MPEGQWPRFLGANSVSLKALGPGHVPGPSGALSSGQGPSCWHPAACPPPLGLCPPPATGLPGHSLCCEDLASLAGPKAKGQDGLIQHVLPASQGGPLSAWGACAALYSCRQHPSAAQSTPASAPGSGWPSGHWRLRHRAEAAVAQLPSLARMQQSHRSCPAGDLPGSCLSLMSTLNSLPVVPEEDAPQLCPCQPLLPSPSQLDPDGHTHVHPLLCRPSTCSGPHVDLSVALSGSQHVLLNKQTMTFNIHS